MLRGKIDLDHVKAKVASFAHMALRKNGGGGDQMPLLVRRYCGGGTVLRLQPPIVERAGLDLAKNIGVLFLGNNVDLIFAGSEIAVNEDVAAPKQIARGGVFPFYSPA